MKHFNHVCIYILLVSIVFALPISANESTILTGRSFLAQRSQSVDAGRQVAIWHRYTHRFDYKKCYATLTAMPAYNHSFRPQRIAEYFFGCDKIYISGSQVANRADFDILADYFGLSPSFNSMVEIQPNIRNALFDLSLFGAYEKLYFELHVPIVWTQTEIELKESIGNDAFATIFPERYMATDAVTPPVRSFKEAIAGDITFGDVKQGIQFGKISYCPQTERGLADVRLVLGYDIINRWRGHAGFNIRAAIPSGTRPTSEYLLEPVVGNGHHWELGLGFNGRVLLWEKGGNQTIDLSTEVNFTHIFAARQKRSFDFCKNGFWSRYILLKEFDSTGTYDGCLIPAINVTTLNANVHASVQFDFALVCGYTYKQFGIDAGYGAWARSREKISLLECIPEKKYGLKGIQNVELNPGPGPSNVTQSTATIVGNNFADQAIVADPNSPVFISTTDLDLRSGASSRMFTHKLLLQLQYACDIRNATSFIGTGFEVDFEGIRDKENIQPNKNSVSQWGIWVVFGCTF